MGSRCGSRAKLGNARMPTFGENSRWNAALKGLDQRKTLILPLHDIGKDSWNCKLYLQFSLRIWSKLPLLFFQKHWMIQEVIDARIQTIGQVAANSWSLMELEPLLLWYHKLNYFRWIKFRVAHHTYFLLCRTFSVRFEITAWIFLEWKCTFFVLTSIILPERWSSLDFLTHDSPKTKEMCDHDNCLRALDRRSVIVVTC